MDGWRGLPWGTAMTARAKFLFDADFGRVKEAPPQITPEAHQAAVAAAELRGYERGVASAEAQARSEAERRTAAAAPGAAPWGAAARTGAPRPGGAACHVALT